MPIYEYECRKCKEKFEVIQSGSEDESKVQCPKCHTDKPQRVLSPFSSASSKSSSASCAPTGST